MPGKLAVQAASACAAAVQGARRRGHVARLQHGEGAPDQLGQIKHPILVWRMGGCAKDSTGNGVFTELLREFVSLGILVVSDGTPGGRGLSSGGAGGLMGDGTALIKAIDWAIKENDRPCSKYYQKLDVTKIAVSGQSCGGLMAINAAVDHASPPPCR